MTEIAIRDFRPGPKRDTNFVMSSWLNSYIKNRTFLWRHIGFQRAIEGHRPIVTGLLARSRLRVAVDPAADNVILGWACSEHEALHYIFVKLKFRRCGIARALIEDAGDPKIMSHTTPVGRRVLQHKFQMVESPGHAFYPPVKGQAA